MASGTKSKGAKTPKGKGAKGRSDKGGGVKAARSSVVAASKPKPWGTILAIVVIVLLAGGVFTYAFTQISEKEKWIVSEENQDPSDNIAGVVKVEYDGGQHVTPEQRVDYDQSPPFGGPHDGVWADCSGTVYDTAVRNENMVHALEHGSVWIAYNPDEVTGAQLDTLTGKVDGQPHMMLSPYPGLDRPVSLQSWGHQLKLDDANDARIDQFIRSLRQNDYQNPEPGGRCDSQGTGFDPANPPAFDEKPPGKDAVPMSGEGAGGPDMDEVPGAQPPGAEQPADGEEPAGDENQGESAGDQGDQGDQGDSPDNG